MSGFLRSFSDNDLKIEAGKAKLGTLIGVFLPSIQNVFGVLMFLRMPWCVGMMGIPQAFLMVFSCCFIVSILLSLFVVDYTVVPFPDIHCLYFECSRHKW